MPKRRTYPPYPVSDIGPLITNLTEVTVGQPMQSGTGVRLGHSSAQGRAGPPTT